MCNTPNTDLYGNVIKTCYCDHDCVKKVRIDVISEIKDAYDYWIDDDRAVSDFSDILNRMAAKAALA